MNKISITSWKDLKGHKLSSETRQMIKKHYEECKTCLAIMFLFGMFWALIVII